MTRAATLRPMDEAAGAGQLALQHCEACGAAQYPPVELCRVCLSERLAWTRTATLPGELIALTTVQHSFEPSTPLPQPVGLVRLRGEVTAVCFVDPQTHPGAVTVRANQDAAGRAVLTAASC